MDRNFRLLDQVLIPSIPASLQRFYLPVPMPAHLDGIAWVEAVYRSHAEEQIGAGGQASKL